MFPQLLYDLLFTDYLFTAVHKPPTLRESRPVYQSILENHATVRIAQTLGNSTLDLVIRKAASEYDKYNNSNHCKYSLFHFHGKTGRKRVGKWLMTLNNFQDETSLKTEIICYLSDKNNGNTHPHSFRTMLLDALINGDNQPTEHLKETSKSFTQLLKEYCAVAETSKETEMHIMQVQKN